MSSTTSTTNTKMSSEKIVKTVNILRCKVVNIDKLQDLLGHSIIILRGLICEPDQITALTGRRRGRCKWFNVAKGWGFITPNDGGPDVFVHQSVIQMNGFRSLGDEEEVEFECKVSDKGLEATLVTGVEGLECKGSHRRPISRKKFKKVRCYNCGEFANHIAAKCNMGPQPKKCHHCKAVDHLIADCPVKDDKPKTKKSKQLQPSVSSDGEDERNEDESQDKSQDKPEGKCESKVENKSLDELQDESVESETINESTSLTRPTSSCCSTVKEDPTGSTEVTECVITSTPSLNSTCLTQSETTMLTLSLPVPEPCESSEVNEDCCVIIMNNKLNVETSEMGSEDDVSLVTVETQSTSSSVSSDHGKEVRSDSGIIVRDDDCMNGRSNSRNSCDINNNNNNDSNNDESKNNDTNDTDHSNDIMDSKIIANNIKNVENCNNSFNNSNNNLNLNNKLFSSVESLTTGNNLLNTEPDKHSIASSLIQLPQPESS